MRPETFYVNRWLSLFRQTGNPIYAWKTIQNARIFKQPIPEEILSYLGYASYKIVSIANNPPSAKDRPSEVFSALGLGKKGAGAASVFKDYSDRQALRQLAMQSFFEIEKGASEYAVFDEVAEKFKEDNPTEKISGTTVRRAYKEHLVRWEKMAECLIAESLITIDKQGFPCMKSVGTADDLREASILLALVEKLLNE